MSKVISGKDLKARLMARRDSVVDENTAWLEVLASPVNRELLLIIYQANPQSIGELARIADRVQPNVSRSLSLLMRAGLVHIIQNGRMSVPSLTSLGLQKVEELGFVKRASDQVGEKAAGLEDEVQGPSPYIFISYENSTGGGLGRLCINASMQNRIVVGTDEDDIRAATNRFFDNWWRIWYRRDAPYKVGNFSTSEDSRLTLLLRSTGPRIERLLRKGGSSQLERDAVDRASFEHELIESIFRPVLAASHSRQEIISETLASNLSRLEDSYGEPAERDFCRTAGALNLMPYRLSNEVAGLVRDLISFMPDEDSRLDFASVMPFDDVEKVSARIQDQTRALKRSNTLSRVAEISTLTRNEISGLAGSGFKPWQKGVSAAKILRSYLDLSREAAVGDVVSLAQLFGGKNFELSSFDEGTLAAFQQETNGAPTVLVQKEWGAIGSAFALARSIGDYLVFQSGKSCVTNRYTDRQAVGRAFAAEFMAPAAGIIAMVDEDEKSFDEVAWHYGVPFDVVNHQYRNNLENA
ncbi:MULTISPECIES: ArsR family transcriptional regulator [Xanthomonas]|uniref:HVO_A0114 family putative DNA-binding protein n=1 Tax=Xanthomonas TaxID=338 RepID=UPI002B23DFB1|nr:ArsR family transcriptional regulator [Xanthomonas campestris]MEA9761792.1 ArsR family transcriptional regulator [Xanthomonas campestris pv. raphani]MEA9814001.1 ArsR family transcriptional regulator [Xanthomonas campestris pv. raphani]MEA9907104.1 ArsR family transcriptional regulator [Xanthomonas campestris pv. raphani]MEA9923401.1 ArsR family transcriptional regulator [Xanthomonas campestris pv. raphani]MEA9935790.1 ArsR family transcriptional regulator [Xanthomonas campestris pv. raphan